MMLDVRPLQIAVLGILDNADKYEWSVQGFGMLRLYIRKLGRLHIWDSMLRYPGVSMIHNHSWDLRSTIVAGELTNVIFSHNVDHVSFSGKRLVTGYQTHDVSELPTAILGVTSKQSYLPGECYSQAASLIHRTDAADGTITLMERQEDENGQADVYWPYGTEWGTAKPRPATTEEIKATCGRAIAGLLADMER